MPIYMNYGSQLSQQVLHRHNTNRFQARGLSEEGAAILAEGKLPTRASDLTRLYSEFGRRTDSRMLLPALMGEGALNVHPGGVNFHPGGVNTPNLLKPFAGPGGGPHLQAPALNSSSITDGTSNTVQFGEEKGPGTGPTGCDPHGIIAILIGL